PGQGAPLRRRGRGHGTASTCAGECARERRSADRLMKVVALGDAHLGRSYLPYTEGGVNVRERDFELSFEAAVDLALEQEPDAVMWLGDIFDHPRPTYRSFRLAQRALTKLRDAGVPVVVITGNHDTPRL